MTTTPATILLVEDDSSMLEGMRDLLTLVELGEYDVQVVTAGNGRLGLEAIMQQIPDLIVSDIMMPEMDGFEFLRRVRQNPNWVHIPVIFLTAKGSKQDIHKGRSSGADLYITKPFNSNEFLELIHSQLDRAFQLSQTRQEIMTGLKKDILQILNHEFRTPLTYVTAYYEMLADSMNRMQDDDNFQEFLRGIQVGCVRLTRLVEDFIQVLEIRTGEMKKRFQVNARPIRNLPELIREAVIDVQPKSNDFAVQIHYQPETALPPVLGDTYGLQQVFVRLLENAVKFTHSRVRGGGCVYLKTQVVDGQVRIAFVDEGVGFPPQMKERLFDLFFQHNRVQLEQQGSGIGLTIAKAWVDLHGGTIEAENRDGGVGSVFTVILPAYEEGMGVTAVQDTDGNLHQAKVLIVEDDPHLLAGLQELLEISAGKYHLHVETAENGRVGLEVLNRYEPDLIISDIMMPEIGGFEFLEKVREKPEWVQIPFIFLTAKGEHSDIHRGWRSGVEEYITKPYDSDELLELVTTQLDRHFQKQSVIAQDFDGLKRSILQLITPDFRLPLSAVSKYSDKLISGMANVHTDQDLKYSLGSIKEGSVKLTRLVEDLIAMAELETGEAETAFALRAQPIRDMGLLLYEAGQKQMLRAGRQGITIHCEMDEEMPQVYSDGVSISTSLIRFVEIVVSYCIEVGYQGDLKLQSVCMGDELHLVVHVPVPLSSALIDAFTAALDTAVSFNTDPGIRILRGTVALHNGRLLLNDTLEGTDIVIALPIYHPENDEQPTFATH
ncbi:MAG: response regulator [Ardenticatenaceae bacterium]|nr:response regulator [Anaerolineales bacterium]MCB8922809.1 response regulator [Ardenticatenaceae bacterium]MCB8991942.1 response regulator [Ardenticatenaceae bacterium]MCB9004752.1 response regulator [Ardenticatenaceae bacterium]